MGWWAPFSELWKEHWTGSEEIREFLSRPRISGPGREAQKLVATAQGVHSAGRGRPARTRGWRALPPFAVAPRLLVIVQAVTHTSVGLRRE